MSRASLIPIPDVVSLNESRFLRLTFVSGAVVYNWVFLRKVVRQSHTDVTSFCMQFEKIGRGLLWEAFQSEGDCFLPKKRGEIRKDCSGKRR